MRITQKEQVNTKYLYVDENNVVHVLIPIIDKDAKISYSLEEFFGYAWKHTTNNARYISSYCILKPNQKNAIKGELLAYKKALENDLIILSESNALLTQQKQERLTQINAYLDIIECIHSKSVNPDFHLAHESYVRSIILTAFTQDDFIAIKKIFAERHAEIKRSSHFNEFFLLYNLNKGDVFIYKDTLCTNFAKFVVNSPLFDLTQELTKPLERACIAADTLSTEIIPTTKNLGEIEVNTRSMDNTALQVLYEQIEGFKDRNIKKQLLAQLKQERPDFKPQINAKKFLQLVANGKQNEAEKLINQAFAQEFLRTKDIPFTDECGRTFTCTAYEYAWWAKDAHMLKMLEKYIKQDDETKKFILSQIKTIEAQRSILGFFKSSKPQGLHYTTKTSNGKTIDHWEAHFDLTPLKRALKTCVNACQKTDAKCKDLQRYLMQVGLTQRNLPAHISQEYCHPDRSFYDVLTNTTLLNVSHPYSLYRGDQAEVALSIHEINSGLGSSFAILRASYNEPQPVREIYIDDDRPRIDLSVIEAIDEVRTNDLQQSLKELSQSVIVQEPSLSVALSQ